MPHAHPGDPNGPCGSHGIFRLTVPGHVEIGLYSGRANAAHQPGPPPPTMGSIRTTDDAMQSIATAVARDPLTTIEVTNNTVATVHLGVAHHGAQAHAH